MALSLPASESALAALFEPAAYRRANPALLQPADSFLELSGEDIRRRLFLTYDAAGHELCLRPEFTIPVCRGYLEEMPGAHPANYWYLGPVFRHRPEGGGEFLQGGIESLGRQDRPAADAEILDFAIQACRALGQENPSISLGDVGLIDALFTAMALPPDTARRLRKALAAGQPVEGILSGEAAAAPSGLADYAGVLKALEGVDKRQAQAFVEDVLSIAGLTSVGGRSVGDIAERFLAKSGQAAGGPTPEQHRLIVDFLALKGNPDDVSAAARKLTREAGIDIEPALDAFDNRTGFMAARGIDLASVEAHAGFSRNMDYYTGFVFELGAVGHERPLVGGGRYDNLLTRLGAPEPLPAVGCSIWIERFGDAA